MAKNQIFRLSFAPVAILVAISGCFSQQKSEGKDSTNSAAVVVSIPNEGEIYLGKERLALEQLGRRIQSVLRGQSPDDQVVYIKASKHLTYGTVVDVIDTIREAGFDRIGLVAKQSDERTSTDSNGKIIQSRLPTIEEKGVAQLIRTPDDLLIVTIMSNRIIKLNSRPVRLEQLERQLARILDKRLDKAVFIRARRTLAYGDVIQIIDIVKTAGAQPIGLQTDVLQ